MKHQSRFPSFALRLTALGIFPVIQLFLVRQLSDLNYFLSPSDLVLPLSVFCVLLFFHTPALKLRFSIPALYWNLGFLALYLAACLGSPGIPFYYQGKIPFEAAYALSLFVVLGMLVSGLFIFADFPAFLAAIRKALPYAALAGLARIEYEAMQKVLWLWFSGISTWLSKKTLTAAGFDILPCEGSYRICHPLMNVDIHAACSGLDGIFLFAGSFSFLMMLDHTKYTGRQILTGYAAGILTMILMNVVRISVFLGVALETVRRYGKGDGTRLLLSLFHGNIGWVLYAAGLVVFYGVFFTATSKKRTGFIF